MKEVSKHKKRRRNKEIMNINLIIYQIKQWERRGPRKSVDIVLISCRKRL